MLGISGDCLASGNGIVHVNKVTVLYVKLG